MKKHILHIEVEQREDKKDIANLDVMGDKTVIAQAICGLLQTDLRFKGIILEAILNAIGHAGHHGVHIEEVHNHKLEMSKE